MNQKYWNYFKG